MQCPAGKLLSHIADLDAMLQCPGFAITADEIDIESWRALRVLWDERIEYQKESQRREEMRQQANANGGKEIRRRR